jgi:hypothetical protein
MALEVIFKLWPTLRVVAEGWQLDVPDLLDLLDLLDGNKKIVGLMQ